ncbi:ML5 [Symbiodinium necroappetens]|uniref:ML5 protein n=1 Tax=Symbiodinium necroappetens TaxID=1628268 RepID=A0A812X3I6_9DINO|nr:ML5 [Symbiodinium necroappetens]
MRVYTRVFLHASLATKSNLNCSPLSLHSPAGEELTLSVRRPEHREISLVREGNSLGVKLHYKKSSRGVVINEILPDGLLKNWNDAHPSSRIVPGDRILAIGGATSGAEDMTKMLSTDDKLDLTILHYGQAMQEHSFRRHASEKQPKASPAHLQGLRNNVLHFANRGRRLDLHDALAQLDGEVETSAAEASRCFEAAKAKLEVAIAKVLADAGREGRGKPDGQAKAVTPLGWVEKALRDLAQEVDPQKHRRGGGFNAGWVAETFAKLVGGTPVTPRGTCRADALLQPAPAAWEHPQGKVGGWVDEAFVALMDDCKLKELPSRSLCEGVGALQRLKSLGGWAWVAFA